MKVCVASASFSKNAVLRSELLELYPEARFNDSGRILKGSELIEFVGDSEAVIAGQDRFDRTVLESCTDLKVVSKYGVGLDNLDLEAMKKMDIRIGWTGGVNRLSVAEMTLCFMLSLARNIYSQSFKLKNSSWIKNGGNQLTGMTVGIIGVGYIGKEVIRLLKPFNCQVLVNDIVDQSHFYTENGLEETDKDSLIKRSGIITIHTPLDNSTRNMISEKRLKSMGENTFLINTARAGIVNMKALLLALEKGWIAGAACDVYDIEPCQEMSLLSRPDFFCTPHIGGNSREAVLAMGRSAIRNLTEQVKEKHQ